MPLSTSRVAVYIQFKLMSYVRENEEICVVCLQYKCAKTLLMSSYLEMLYH